MIKILLLPLLYFVPFLAFAETTLLGIISDISDIFAVLIPLLITLALLYFLWGVIKYVTAGGDEEKRKEGIGTMIYGVIALFVIISVWGLVAVLNLSFGVGAGGGPEGIPGPAGDTVFPLPI